MNSFLKGIAITAVILIPSYILFLVYMLNKKDPNAIIIDSNLKGIISIQNLYILKDNTDIPINDIPVDKYEINMTKVTSKTVNDITIYNIPSFKLMILTQNLTDKFKLYLKDKDGLISNNLQYNYLPSALTIEANFNMKNNLNEEYFLILEDNGEILNSIILFVSSEDKKV